jgi:hypothetical protein
MPGAMAAGEKVGHASIVLDVLLDVLLDVCSMLGAPREP